MDAKTFYQDPAMRVAAEAMRQGHAGVPSHETVEAIHARTSLAPATAARLAGARPVTRQARAALAGRPVQPLPTRTVRRARRAQRRMVRRLGLAAPVALVVLIVLLAFIPAVAAVTLGLSVGSLILAYAK
jgi:hypothetical protein